MLALEVLVFSLEVDRAGSQRGVDEMLFWLAASCRVEGELVGVVASEAVKNVLRCNLKEQGVRIKDERWGDHHLVGAWVTRVKHRGPRRNIGHASFTAKVMQWSAYTGRSLNVHCILENVVHRG